MTLFILERFSGNRPARHAILFAYPLAKINEFAAFRTKGTEGIILPVDLFVAGRTFHEPDFGQT